MIDAALRYLSNSRRDGEQLRDFLAGYFTSLLAPGTLEHADILASVAPVMPTAYLWYGLCAGVNFRGDALPIGNPLARRIIRDLTVPDRLIDRPRCDVALEELSMHGPGESLLRLTAKAGRLDIDILPGVTMAVRWPPNDAPNSDDARRARDLEIEHLMIELDEYSARSRQLTERLRNALRFGEPDRQGATKKNRKS